MSSGNPDEGEDTCLEFAYVSKRAVKDVREAAKTREENARQTKSKKERGLRDSQSVEQRERCEEALSITHRDPDAIEEKGQPFTKSNQPFIFYRANSLLWVLLSSIIYKE